MSQHREAPGTMTTQPRSGSAGFLLIELMLVVAIIGVLAAIAIPQFSEYTRKAERSEAYTLGREAMKNVAAFYDRWGRLPRDNAEAGLPPAKALVGRNVGGIDIKDGVVEVLLAGKAIAKDQERATLRFVPTPSKDFPTAPLLWAADDSQLKARK